VFIINILTVLDYNVEILQTVQIFLLQSCKYDVTTTSARQFCSSWNSSIFSRHTSA